MSNSKTYAVVIDGKTRGTYFGAASTGYMRVAGAVTRDGAPVNSASAYLSLDGDRLADALLSRLPEYEKREHNGHSFLTVRSDDMEVDL